MTLEFTHNAITDIRFYKSEIRNNLIASLTRILKDMVAHPFTGLGRPGTLKYDLETLWIRSINRDHKIIYQVIDERIIILCIPSKGYYSQDKSTSQFIKRNRLKP